MKLIPILLFFLFLLSSYYWTKYLFLYEKERKENIELKIHNAECDSINTVNIFKVDSIQKANITYSILFNNLLESYRKSTNAKR